ncbi:helix-turn-helix domain-containing protein [Amycolatopsis rubida]|uniref:AraC-type DNA-binding protein n=1 Tax=Amycolatopsis rubida TaxID=112413 RepID=A0A1I6B911_9PSEU|nr:helix-turn-helix domain-containing protein [Amycolatopsis rubida]SFQ77433.1 AraC-type DNA-binding protein [Amycolatopsis rubida]
MDTVIEIRQLVYQPPGESGASVETMSFAKLRRLDRGASERGDFHVLAVVRRGHGAVSIDFARHSLSARSVVWIRPGVVHRWDDLGDLAGDVVLFVPTAPAATPGSRALAAGPGALESWTVAEGQWPLVTAALAHLRGETAAASGAGELLGLVLSALLLRVAPPVAGGESGQELFPRFQVAVEEDFRLHHDIAYYARKLGCSPRTLSRAVRSATGRGGKEYLCERLVLEAKRLLAHDRLGAARCGQRLGFPDAANFSAFFAHQTGVRPGRWQSETLAGRDQRGLRPGRVLSHYETK